MEKVAALRGTPLKGGFFRQTYGLTLTESGTSPV
jgi:hypothetical protein